VSQSNGVKHKTHLLKVRIDLITVLHTSLSRETSVRGQRERIGYTRLLEYPRAVTVHPRSEIAGYLEWARASESYLTRFRKARRERTRIFIELRLRTVKGALETGRGERHSTRTSATSKIFLNCIFAFTFTVMAIRRDKQRNKADLMRTYSRSHRNMPHTLSFIANSQIKLRLLILVLFRGHIVRNSAVDREWLRD